MNKRNIFLIIILLIIGLLLTLPYGLGYLSERQVKQFFSQYQVIKNVKFELVEYQRGWFQSSAKVHMEVMQPSWGMAGVDAPLSKEPIMEFTIHNTINHGPILWHGVRNDDVNISFGRAFIHTKLQVTKGQEHFLEEHLKRSQLAKARSRIGLSGAGEIRITSNKIALNMKQLNTVLRYDSLTSLFSFGRNIRQFTSRTVFDNLTATTPKVLLTMNSVELRQKYQRNNKGLWLGDTVANYPFSTVAIDGKNRLVVNNLQVKSDRVAKAKIVDQTLWIEVQKAIVNEVSYGPASFRLALLNIDAESLAKLHKVARHKRMTVNNYILSSSDQEQVMAIANVLFSRGFQLRLSPFDLNTPEGEISLQMWLTLPNVHGQDKALSEVADYADASLTLSIPKTIVVNMVELYNSYAAAYAAIGIELPLEQVQDPQALLDSWLANDFIDSDGNRYRFTAAIKNKQIYVNGIPVDFEGMNSSDGGNPLGFMAMGLAH